MLFTTREDRGPPWTETMNGFFIRPRYKAASRDAVRRERGKRRNADTSHPHGKPTAFTLPYQNHPSLISGFIF